jgi:hypothetical protein
MIYGVYFHTSVHVCRLWSISFNRYIIQLNLHSGLVSLCKPHTLCQTAPEAARLLVRPEEEGVEGGRE